MATKNAPAAAVIGCRRERRRQRRLEVEIDVTVKSDKVRLTYRTLNVNRGGLFLRTDHPARPREMIELVIDLGGPLGQLDAVAVVRHATSREEARGSGRVPGMGVQFYGLSNGEQARWDAYVRQLAEREAEAAVRPAFGPSSRDGSRSDDAFEARRAFQAEPTPVVETPPEALRAVSSDNEGEMFPLVMRSVEGLRAFFKRDYGADGIFIPTDRRLAPGTPTTVRVIHPTSREAFDLSATVSWLSPSSGAASGVRVLFADPSEAERDAFEVFVETGQPPLELT
jgi:Tfp pilus assembly protein PilZ